MYCFAKMTIPYLSRSCEWYLVLLKSLSEDFEALDTDEKLVGEKQVQVFCFDKMTILYLSRSCERAAFSVAQVYI